MKTDLPVVAILLVDDRPENLLALEASLEPLGQRLVKAASGDDALRAVLDEQFAVILMDIRMPGLDGFETMALLKQRVRSRHTPIIFLTAYPEQHHGLQSYTSGAVDFILKPFDPDMLRSKVSVFVQLRQTSSRCSGRTTRSRPRTPSSSNGSSRGPTSSRLPISGSSKR